MAGESIGMGDSALIMLLGFLFGVRRQVLWVFLAVLFCALAAAVLMITRRVGRKSRLPFVPFLLAAFCVTLI
jgi:leader peptidase (prepilin peptidase)/N-methyltransferase